AAAQADADKSSSKRQGFPAGEPLAVKQLNVGRLLIISLASIALVAGILTLVMNYPGGSSDEPNRPAPGASIGEMMNGTTTPPASEQPAPQGTAPAAQPSTNFTPLPPGEGAAPAAAPATPEFTSGA